jgi:hypothetical protein
MSFIEDAPNGIRTISAPKTVATIAPIQLPLTVIPLLFSSAVRSHLLVSLCLCRLLFTKIDEYKDTSPGTDIGTNTDTDTDTDTNTDTNSRRRHHAWIA